MRIFVFQSAATADEQISDMNIENYIEQAAARAVERLYPQAAGAPIQIQRTRREFEGDYTLVVFPLLKASRKAPEATAAEIGEALVAGDNGIESYNVVKGFLNMTLRRSFWNEKIAEIASDDHFGYGEPTGRTVMVEYSSPNTNKPLHLGHIRNNLLGYSVAEILKACGNRVIKANLVNDRGIHICKSMLAWQKFGGGETPASSGMKGDHLVGKYYVEFDRHYKEEVRELVAQGQSEEEAKRNAPIMREAQEMLRRWEAKEPETYALWETMNGWVYDGFDKTYAALGIDFDKTYYESQTYLLGKELVEEGLRKGVFYRRPDNSVWIDLTADGLDEKLLLRGDGTSVYMTQDLGTAYRRFEDNRLDELIYVVGNEQNYHFQVLKLVLKKLGYEAWSDHIFHLSYGMVELPEGKMKSREGTVVDADDLIEDMVSTAMEMSRELGKLDDATWWDSGHSNTSFSRLTPRRPCFSTRANPSTSTAIRGLSSSTPMHASARCCARPERPASPMRTTMPTYRSWRRRLNSSRRSTNSRPLCGRRATPIRPRSLPTISTTWPNHTTATITTTPSCARRTRPSVLSGFA